jgi:hypothetical protein
VVADGKEVDQLLFPICLPKPFTPMIKRLRGFEKVDLKAAGIKD